MNRPAQLLGAGALGLWGLGFGLVDPEALAAAVAPAMARAELGRLGAAANLVGPDGEPRQAPITVELGAGGPPWLEGAIRQAVAAQPRPFVRLGPSAHRLWGDVVVAPGACALGLSLERRGWVVRPPSPTRRRLRPELAGLPLAVGVAAGMWTRVRAWFAALVAASLAQLALAAWPWPAGFPPVSWVEDLGQGPVVAPVLAWGEHLGERGVWLAWGVVAVCGVALALDLGRRRTAPKSAVLTGAVGVLAAVAWVEAAVRAGFVAWLSTGMGMGIAVVAGVAWAGAWALGRRGEPR